MLKRSVSAILIVSALIAVTCGNLFAAIPAVEREALIALYNSTDGPNWTDSTNWLGEPGTECTWFGVTCDEGNNHLTELKLSKNQLMGNIPPELGNLSELTFFDLSQNHLTGSIPPKLGNLFELTFLSLSENQLTGGIPPELGNLTALTLLYLSNNRLTEGIPPELGNLTNLLFLSLYGNQLTENIPSELGNLINLFRLYLSNNKLSKNIPPELGNLPNLTELSLHENKLTGTIPPELGNLSKLTKLYLSENQLRGSIPPELGNLSNLTELYLWGNQLTGITPPELGKLSNLMKFALSRNQLTGAIPSELGNLSNLTVLYLWENQLTGIIPPELGKLSNLTELDLSMNHLTGIIPSELGNLSHLTLLGLWENQLTGVIPPELGKLSNLTKLYLHKNQLKDNIPSELGNLSNLTNIGLSDNQLAGPIPTEFMNLTKLEDGENDFRRNSLYTSDADLRAFLNRKQIDGDWESYQILNSGYKVTSDLWIRAVIRTVEKGSMDAVWQKGGEDWTEAGDCVIWGYFYADPDDVTWGSGQNPDLFVKIWLDRSGRVDVNFFHVSVPDIEVYSDYPYDNTPDEQGIATMDRRYIRHYYNDFLLENPNGTAEQYEDGTPASGYSPSALPSGIMTVNNLKFASVINTVEKGGIEAFWQLGGQSFTARKDQVVWGYFYADPSKVNWGSGQNPDLFVKIWYDVSGRIDVNFFHVSVPDIEVYSDCAVNKVYDNKGTAILNDRYIRHEYYGIDIFGNKNYL